MNRSIGNHPFPGSIRQTLGRKTPLFWLLVWVMNLSHPGGVFFGLLCWFYHPAKMSVSVDLWETLKIMRLDNKILLF